MTEKLKRGVGRPKNGMARELFEFANVKIDRETARVHEAYRFIRHIEKTGGEWALFRKDASSVFWAEPGSKFAERFIRQHPDQLVGVYGPGATLSVVAGDILDVPCPGVA